MIRNQNPARLSSISRVYRGDLELIVGTALEKDKTRRYQSAADLSADLSHYLAGEPITQTEWALFRAHFGPRCTLHVGLGSTEALHYRQRLYTWDDAPVDPVLPLGDPVPDKEVLLVDEHGAPVAPGVTGELWERTGPIRISL